MTARDVIEGTGDEIAEFAQRHPRDRFKLVPLTPEGDGSSKPAGPDQETWDEVMKFIHSYKGKLPVLPLAATSTDSLYD